MSMFFGKKQWSKLIACILALTMIFTGLVPADSVLAANERMRGETYAFNADSYNKGMAGPLTGLGDSGYFSIAKSVSITAKEGSYGTLKFHNRIKLSGSGKVDTNYISFVTSGSATVVVYASCEGDNRKLAIKKLKEDGKSFETISSTEGVLNTKSSELGRYFLEIPDAGEYYLMSTSGGINIASVEVRERKDPVGSTPAVSNLTIETKADKMVLSWTHTGYSAGTYYGIDVSYNGGSRIKYDETYENSYTFIPNASGTYQFYVYGVGDSGKSTSIESQAIEFSMKLEAPEVKVTAKDEALEVTWNSVPEADSYKVSLYNASEEMLTSKDISTTSYTFENLENGTTYKVKVEAFRNSDKSSSSSGFISGMPDYQKLEQPVVRAMTEKTGVMKVIFSEVPKATSYEISYAVKGSTDFTKVTEAPVKDGEEYSVSISGLTVGTTYVIHVVAKGENRPDSDPGICENTLRENAERDWQFTYFGTSTSKDTNRISDGANIYDGFQLFSCTVKNDGTINKKGGKFVGGDGYDGISFYYTKVDAAKENFELTGTFTVDYINPTPDGQEGFALLIRDSLGEYGSTASFFTNSAAAIATKVEYTNESGNKISLKDGLAARFVSGLTSTTAAGGQTHQVIPLEYAKSSGNIIKQGESYTFTVKKTNTGYHVLYTNSDGELVEEILYGPESLLAIDPDYVYVGFAVARGVNVTVSNINMKVTDPATDPEAQERPMTTRPLSYKVDSPKTYAMSDYKFVFLANADGVLTVKDQNGKVVTNKVNVSAGVDFVDNYKLKIGNNSFTVSFKPNDDFKFNEYEKLESYEEVTSSFTVSYKTYMNQNTAIYVSPNGTKDGNGTRVAPLDIYTAVNYVQPGQTIVLQNGTYHLTNTLKIARGIDGTEEKPITMVPENKAEKVIFDFSDLKGSAAAMQIWGNYWYIQGIDVCNTPDKIKGVQVAGNYNTMDLINTYNNGDTGLQISGISTETIEKWPSYNLILNCTSYNNADASMEDADGFAAKLTAGKENIFRGCIAYCNADDGWDLFAKTETGTIGAVTIENCVAYRNGYLLDGTVAGNGNGFKMGGTNLPGGHILINSISYDNKAKGIDSNSCPDIKAYQSTSYNNEKNNVAMYTNNSSLTTDFVAEGILSYKDAKGTEENFTLYNQDALDSEDNYFFNGDASMNISGKEVSADWFKSLDTSVKPERQADGSIDMHGLLELTSAAPANTGARFEATPSKEIKIPTILDAARVPSSSNDDDDDDNYVSTNTNTSNSSSTEDQGDTTGSWKMTEAGWWYLRADNSYPNDNWLKINGNWYLFDTTGYMQTGWKLRDGSWYYLESSGAMQTGWKEIAGVWYYLENSGAMKTGWVLDKNNQWYFMNPDGSMKTGWVELDGVWYFLNEDGKMAADGITPDGYYVDKDGRYIP